MCCNRRTREICGQLNVVENKRQTDHSAGVQRFRNLENKIAVDEIDCLESTNHRGNDRCPRELRTLGVLFDCDGRVLPRRLHRPASRLTSVVIGKFVDPVLPERIVENRGPDLVGTQIPVDRNRDDLHRSTRTVGADEGRHDLSCIVEKRGVVHVSGQFTAAVVSDAQPKGCKVRGCEREVRGRRVP